MKFDCEYSELVNVGSIKPHPRNNNKHPQEQLEKFVEIIKKKNVWRVPLIVSKRSGFLVSGHLRLQVAKELGLPQLPVVYQDFDSDADEYQFLTFDNEIARWANLDMNDVMTALDEIENLELEDLGILDFDIVLKETINESKEININKVESPKTVECPACGHEF